MRRALSSRRLSLWLSRCPCCGDQRLHDAIERVSLAAGSRGYIRAIVIAQMLAQIGAFALPALLPDYIARWNLSKTEAGWLVGIFFARYAVMGPLRLCL